MRELSPRASEGGANSRYRSRRCSSFVMTRKGSTSSALDMPGFCKISTSCCARITLWLGSASSP